MLQLEHFKKDTCIHPREWIGGTGLRKLEMKKGKNEKVIRHRHTMETCAEIGRPEWWAGSLACETTQSNSLLD